MEGKALGQLHKIFNGVKLQPNLTQNTAISFVCCFDGHAEKTGQIAAEASLLFDVDVERDLSLLTIRHYDAETMKKLTFVFRILFYFFTRLEYLKLKPSVFAPTSSVPPSLSFPNNNWSDTGFLMLS